MSDLDASALARASARHGLPVPIGFVEVTGSTNADLKAAARDGAPHGTALVADRQESGRGRLGRRWEASGGQALLVSVLLRTPLPVARVPLLSLAAGVALVEACGPVVKLKWPNDALSADGRKVAGVLAEMDVRDAHLQWVVLGVGVNVHGAPGGVGAASLSELGAAVDRAELAGRFVRAVLDEAARVASDPAAVLDRWRSRSGMLGARVSVGGVTGRAVDVDETGALVVLDARGHRRRVLAGDVEMVGRA